MTLRADCHSSPSSFSSSSSSRGSSWGRTTYAGVVLLFFLLAGIVVLFVGPRSDFGAQLYVRNLVVAHQRVGDDELARIHRERFVLTSCFAGAAGRYVVIAVLLTSVL
ncbi:MAG: hypothetical protein ACREC5_01385 [Thermoplasmata archaeon]